MVADQTKCALADVSMLFVSRPLTIRTLFAGQFLFLHNVQFFQTEVDAELFATAKEVTQAQNPGWFSF